MLRIKALFALLVCIAFVVIAAGTASAGEITGNGQLKAVNGNSPCAYSGQEDLQWYATNEDKDKLANPVKGEPDRTQNWGQTKQATGWTGGANSVPDAEWGCNAHLYGLKP